MDFAFGSSISPVSAAFVDLFVVSSGFGAAYAQERPTTFAWAARWQSGCVRGATSCRQNKRWCRFSQARQNLPISRTLPTGRDIRRITAQIPGYHALDNGASHSYGKPRSHRRTGDQDRRQEIPPLRRHDLRVRPRVMGFFDRKALPRTAHVHGQRAGASSSDVRSHAAVTALAFQASTAASSAWGRAWTISRLPR